MNITDVRVRKVAKEGKMKAVVSITIDEEFVVHQGDRRRERSFHRNAKPQSNRWRISGYRASNQFFHSWQDPDDHSREIPGSCSRGRSCGIRRREVFTSRILWRDSWNAGYFLQKYSCDLPKLFHGILCLNLFYNHVFHYLSRFWIIVKYYVNVTKVK